MPERASASARLAKRPALVGFVLVIALVAGVTSVARVTTSPLGLQPRTASGYGFATKQLVIDSAKSAISDSRKQIAPLGDRAEVFASLLAADPVRLQVARRLAIDPNDLSIQTLQDGLSIGDNADALDEISATAQRKSHFRVQLKAERRGPQGSLGLPLIAVSAQAPTEQDATNLANVTSAVARTFFASRTRALGVKAKDGITVTAIGSAQGATVSAGLSKAKGVLVFVLVALLGMTLILVTESARRPLKRFLLQS